MSDDVLVQRLYKYKDTIVTADSWESFIPTCSEEDQDLFKHYKWLEDYFHSIKHHPDTYHCKPLLLPEAKTLEDILSEIKYFAYPDARPDYTVRQPNFAGVNAWHFVSVLRCPFVEHRKGYYPYAKLKPTVWAKLEQYLVLLDDSFSIKLVDRKDGTCLVTFQYSRIIGNRWLAIIPTDTLQASIERLCNNDNR